jgi:hypothetical protein
MKDNYVMSVMVPLGYYLNLWEKDALAGEKENI